MPGANYMGGKRNAAKARVKDSTGRIQKVFFGRRRLDLLSKGITNNLRESSYHGKGSKLTSLSIDLAHSKQTTEISSRHDGQSFIHSPTRFFSSTPGTRRSGLRTGQQCSSGSSSSQCSKVIDALDTSDPISLRATMDRILSLPDLAGLSAFEFRTPPRSYTTPRGTKRPRRCEEWEPSSGGECKRQKKTFSSKEPEPRIRSIDRQNRLSSQSPILSESISDKIQERAHISDSRSRSGHCRDADLRNSPQGDPCGSDLEQNGDTSYSDFETGLEEYTNELRDCMQSPAAEDALQHRPQSSTSSAVHSESLDSISWPEHYSLKAQLASSRPGTSRENPPDGQSTSSRCSGNDATKDAFHVLPIASPNARHLSFSSDNLYEHEDPWHTIGVLLGLSPISQGKLHTRRHEQTISASHSPKSWQDKEKKHKPSSHADRSLASELGLSPYSSSSRGSSSISGGRLDLYEDGKPLCSPYGNASPDRQTGLNLTNVKSSEKTTLHFDHSPFSSVRLFSSRSGSDRSVKVVCDKENPDLPLRIDLPSASDLVSSNVHAQRSNLLSCNTPDVLRPGLNLVVGHAKVVPTPTVALSDSTDTNEALNDPNGDIKYSELYTEDTEPRNYITYYLPLLAAGEDKTPAASRTTTVPLKELFTSFEMNFEVVDGVFQGPCLFGEDESDFDE